jgi:hypothetical protein
MSVIEAKGNLSPHQDTKYCPHCGKAKPVAKFYRNKDWADQFGLDLWCKDCAAKCLTKDTMREYFWENHREWSDKAWDEAVKKAEGLAANNLTFQRANEERRKKLLEQMACSQMPLLLQRYYKYFDPAKASNASSYAEAKELGEIADDVDPDVKQWSDEWFGYYSPRELSWLNNYYQHLKHDDQGNELDFDHTLDDYAHNIAVQSMIVKKLQSDYRAGRCSMAEVKDAQMVMDTLNKSANFAACRKKPKEEGNKLSIGEIVNYLEQHGHPMTRKIQWEPDDIDRSIAELHHIVRAVGLDE